MDDDDSRLLQTYVQEGSQLAFTILVGRHIDLVFSTALRVLNGDRHLAEDVTQDVFARLARHAPSLRDAPTLCGWLYTTAHHTAINTLRGIARRRRREADALIMQQIHQTGPTAWEQLRPLLDEAMHRLSTPDRDAVLLRFFEGNSFSAIGERLGLSENAARMRVERALDKLHGLLRQRGIGSTSAALGGLLLQHTATAVPAGLAASIGGAAFVAGANSSATFVLLTFMSSIKTSLGLGVAVLVAISFGVWQTRRLDEADRIISTLRTDLAAQSARGKSQPTVVALPAASPATTATPFDEMRAAQEKARRNAEPAKATAKAQIETAVSTEILLRRLQAFRFTAYLHYSALHKALNLSAAQLESFEKIMEERYWALADVTASALTQDLSRFDRAFLDLRRQALDPTEEKLRALLGEPGYRVYTDYEVNSAGRALAGQLNGELSLVGVPLSPEQLSELSQVLTRQAAETSTPAQSWMDASLLGDSPARLSVTTVNWDNVVKEMPKFLSTEQVQALNSIYAQAQLTAKTNREAKKQTEALLVAGRGI